MTESLGAYPAEQSIAPIDSASSYAFSPAASISAPRPIGLSRPAPLVKGDTIGVVAPSYAPTPDWLLRGAKVMEEAGFKVILEPDVDRERRFHHREDEQRAESLMKMWSNPEVKAVIAATGGYGAVRVIPYLDADVFRRDPKIFVGYSDITALHLWMMRCAHLRVFHGPTLDDLCWTGQQTFDSLLAALTNPQPNVRLGGASVRAVRAGRAVGRLTGGNLCLVQQTIGTPYEIDTRDSILFLEETRDPMSFVDERLVHLRSAGLLSGVKGIVFGHLSLDRCEEDEFEDFLLDLLYDFDGPILMDFPAGHEAPNLTLPLGTEMELVTNESTGSLSYHEDALALVEERPRLSLV
ncbi:MAG TPA: LD-carboxypeptidase [Gemmatimonadaceae bacterium]|nr:LD-carboxypeptidase [Gemmatimonadaceae bacterium]